MKRSFSFDVKGRFGIHHPTTSTRNPHECSGYLEPLVPSGEENKYLELLGGSEPPIQVKGCDERCHRGLLTRHSSDCSHSSRNGKSHHNKRKTSPCKKVTNSKGTKSSSSSKSGKSWKKRRDRVFNDSESSTSGTGSGMESLPEDDMDGPSDQVIKTVNGAKYRNVSNNDSPWLVDNVFVSKNDRHSCDGSSNNVPGFLIHPPMLVKRSSFTPSEIDSNLCLSIPPDFDELSPNNRSSVDSNSPLLTWGGSKNSGSYTKDRPSTYQNGFLVTPDSASSKKHKKDLEYLRRSAAHSLETSGESLV